MARREDIARDWFRLSPRRRATAWSEHTTVTLTESMAPETLQPGSLYRFIMGVDSGFSIMSSSETVQLNDPMGALLRRGKFPLTFDALLGELDAAGTVPQQSLFLISEAGQISPDRLNHCTVICALRLFEENHRTLMWRLAQAPSATRRRSFFRLPPGMTMPGCSTTIWAFLERGYGRVIPTIPSHLPRGVEAVLTVTSMGVSL